jgi:Kef-type K+ transport system membrane component KefB
VVANFASHHERAFHEIEHVEWPFMLMFFLLAGATFDLARVPELGLIGLGYVVLRILSRAIGGWIGCRLARLPRAEWRWMGPALLPQAGVAVGMALVAGEAFPDWRDTLLTLIVGTTVVFELIGPPLTMLALRRVRLRAPRPGPATGEAAAPPRARSAASRPCAARRPASSPAPCAGFPRHRHRR